MEILLSARGVSKKYASHKALDHFDLDIPSGKIFGLLGPNGAGKTTFIRIINQIIGPDEGELFFKGEKLVPAHASRIGYLPEERGLYKKMKVGEHAMYLARLKGLSKADAKKSLKDWFEKFQLETWWNKRVEELSKGMQQKIQFVCTVLHKPELLIFDEPFSGFDPINADLIKQEILQLKANGATIIFSTHRMESVEELCDHIALINKSKKILDGPLRDIQLRFRTFRYELIFRGDPAYYQSVISQSGKSEEMVQISEREWKTFFTLQEGKNASQVLGEFVKSLEIIRFNEIIPTANEIFIKSVKGEYE